MSGPLDRIEARAKQVIDRADNEPGWTPAGHFSAPAVLALVNVAKAAEETVASYGNPLYPAYTDETFASGGEFVSVKALRALREALAALGKQPA